MGLQKSGQGETSVQDSVHVGFDRTVMLDHTVDKPVVFSLTLKAIIVDGPVNSFATLIFLPALAQRSANRMFDRT